MVVNCFQDERIEGGYEAVPTRDIHMKQVGLEETWLEYLRLYVKPIVEQTFTGFYSDVNNVPFSMTSQGVGGAR